jgi:hypothetical protein
MGLHLFYAHTCALLFDKLGEESAATGVVDRSHNISLRSSQYRQCPFSYYP